jgi:hypothetical protein
MMQQHGTFLCSLICTLGNGLSRLFSGTKSGRKKSGFGQDQVGKKQSGLGQDQGVKVDFSECCTLLDLAAGVMIDCLTAQVH